MNFKLIGGVNYVPPSKDEYWRPFVDNDGFSAAEIYNQNGYKQFLYYITGVNEEFEKYARGNKFLRLTKLEMLCDKFSDLLSNLNVDYPKKYPCKLQVWSHFEGGMLYLRYLD